MWPKHYRPVPSIGCPLGGCIFLRMQMPMKAQLQLACILLTGLALCAVPARAQLSSYIDDKGHLVFINADPPPVRSPAKRATRAARATPQQPSQIDTQPGPLAT